MNENQLLYIEQLSEQFFSPDSNARSQAEKELSQFSNGIQYIKELLYIINQTQNPYAFHFACSNFHNIFTEYINSFTEQERRDIRNILSQNIINRAEWFFQERNRVACETFGKLCSRVWRLCWFDIPSNLPNLKNSEEMHSEPDDVDPSLIDICLKLIDVNNPLSQILTALTLLNSILHDMSLVVPSVHIYKQKKVINSFKENHLLKIFLATSSTLQKVMEISSRTQLDEATKSVISYGLDVIISILGFTYSGSFTDENYDDIGTIILRSKWIEALKTADLFFQIYNNLEAPYSNKALEVLVFFSAIRSSILKSEKSQLEFLDKFLSELAKILQYKINLESSQNRHNLCRLFVRLKNNYRLDQFLKVKTTMELLNLYSDFCKSLFQYDETSLSTIFYVLSFWNRIAHGLNTIKSPEGIYKMIINILMSFLEMTIKREENSETLLKDKILSSILELFPKLIMCGYEEIGQKILNGCQSLSERYILSCSKNDESLSIIERQLSWVLLFLSSIIFSKNKLDDEVKYLDSNLISSALNIMKFNDERILASGKTESSQYLELAIDSFLLKLSRLGFSIEYEYVIKFLDETHQIHSTSILLNIILDKIMFNIKVWGENSEVIQETLSILHALSEGRQSHKLMLSSPMILQLIQNHNDFDINLSKKFRMNFFKSLTELVLSSSDEALLESFTNSFNIKLKYMENALENNVLDSNLLVNVTYELRGILSSCKLFRHYELFFEWFYESSYYSSIIQRSLKYYAFKDWNVVCSVLRFIKDFTHNVHRRINFPNTSPNGIILFKETAQILIFIASCINQFESIEQDTKLSDIKYKLVYYLFKIFIHIVDGDYCNYGVFSLYNDDILLNLFSSLFTIIFSKDLEDLPFRPKIQEAMYNSLSKLCSFNLNQLFSQDTQKILGNPSETMNLIFTLICTGIKTRINVIMNFCSYAIESITNFHMKHTKKYSNIRSVINESHQNSITKIVFELFDVILTERLNTSYMIYKAIFCSIQLQPITFEIVRDTIIKSQMASSMDKGERMTKLFQDLTEGVDSSFTKENQERFCDNISTFRSNARQFIDIYRLYEYFHQIYSNM